MSIGNKEFAKEVMKTAYALNSTFQKIDQLEAEDIDEKEKNLRKLEIINFLGDLEILYSLPYKYDPVVDYEIDDTDVLTNINKLCTIVELEYDKHDFFQKVDLNFEAHKVLHKMKKKAQKKVRNQLNSFYADYRDHYEDHDWKPNAPQLYGNVDPENREVLYKNILNLMVIGGKSFVDQLHLGKIKKELDLLDWIAEQSKSAHKNIKRKIKVAPIVERFEDLFKDIAKGEEIISHLKKNHFIDPNTEIWIWKETAWKGILAYLFKLLRNKKLLKEHLQNKANYIAVASEHFEVSISERTFDNYKPPIRELDNLFYFLY